MCLGLDIWVSEVMKTDVGIANLCNDFFEAVVNSIRRNIAPQLICKYQLRIPPGWPGPQLPLRLPCSLTSEQLHHKHRRGDAPYLAILRG